MTGIARNLVLMIADAVCVGICWLVVVLSYHACGGGYEPSFYLRMWPIVPVLLGVNVMFRLYHGRLFYPAMPFSPVEEMRRLVSSAILVHVCVVAILALILQTTVGYSRVVIITSGLMTAIFAQPTRDLFRGILRKLSLGQIPVVLVGDGDGMRRMMETLRTNAYLGFRPIGYFGNVIYGESRIPRLGAKSDVVRVSRRKGVRILFVCEDDRLVRQRQHKFARWFTHVEYIPEQTAFPVSGSKTIVVDSIGGIEIVSQARMTALRFQKWALDKSLAVLVFALTLPLLVVIGALVVLTSPGGALFRHERLGKDGKRIWIWKFRTMYRDAPERLERILADNPQAKKEWRENFKLRNDPRVTPLGRFLRKTSLDELPQLFNVLGGSMALVGPRPIVEAEKRYYGESYAVFSSVKPGMTGLWQVSGRSDTGYTRRVSLDTYYVRNWSPWLDLWVLFRTIGAVLFLRGAS